jgi:hypothetical protein
MQKLIHLFMRHPIATALLWLLPAVFLGYRVQEFKMEASTDSLLLESDPDLAFYDESRFMFGSDEYVIVSFSRENIFAPETIALISNLTNDFSAIPGVEKVLSITSVRLLRNIMDEVNLLMLVALPEIKLTTPGCNIPRAREELVKHEVWGENLVSVDGKTTSLIVFFKVDARKGELESRIKELKEKKKAGQDVKAELEQLVAEYNSFEDARKEVRVQIVLEMRKILVRYAGLQSDPVAQGQGTGDTGQGTEAPLHFYTSGLPIIVVDMVRYLERDLVVFGTGVLVFVMLALFVVFRRVRWVLLSIMNCLVLVAVVLGLMVVFGNRPTIVTGNLSSLLFIAAMAHPIHMVVRFNERAERLPQRDFRETMTRTAHDLALPCFYTATTTIAGFASLCIGDLRPVIEFGLFMSLGVALSLLVAFSLFPAGLAILRLPSAERGTENGERGRMSRKGEAPASPDSAVPIGRNCATPRREGDATAELNSTVPPFAKRGKVSPHTLMWYFASFTERHKRAVCLFGLLILMASIGGILQLSTETMFIDYFSRDTEIYRGLDFIDRNMGGTISLEVILEGPEPNYYAKKKNLEKLTAVQMYLNSRPEIGKVLSIYNIIAEVEKTAGRKKRLGLSTAELLKLLPQDMISSYINPDFSKARVFVRVKETSPGLNRNKLISGIKEFLRDRAGLDPAKEKFHVTGIFVLYTNMLNSLMTSQISTFSLVFVAIFIMLAILFMSLRLGFIGTIPNALAICLVLGIMGWACIPLDMATVMIASVTMGIAVDGSIHYIHRYRRELRVARGDFVEAMYRTHATIGRAILFTSFCIVAGFWVLGLSNFKPTSYFGIFTGIAMAAALLANLTLLPACILCLGKRLFPREWKSST